MSGGRFNYENDDAARSIFGWDVDVNYGLERKQEEAAQVAKDNPLEDREISELVFDVFCLLHSYDWYVSSDTSEETYLKDVRFFKKKWLSKNQEERINGLVDRAVERIRSQAKEEIEFLERIKNERDDK